MFMLVDCDNFFVSCERVFQPSLRGRPVVVLSNNDGCVVSRSYEAKALGIPMCAPYFKVENLLRLNNGIALSSNYELYADLSSRTMSMLRQQFGNLEVYSIDEAFVQIPERPNFFTLASKLRQDILNQIGIPVSVGIAATKTLCKIASHFAKKNFKLCQLTEPSAVTDALNATEVSEVWGVGRKIASKLNYLGIFNAAELAALPPSRARSLFNINIEKTVMELNRTPCLGIETSEPAKSIISSGSFEYEINNRERLRQNLAEFVDCACLRLRNQQSAAAAMWVEIHSNRFSQEHRQYNNSTLVSLRQPSDNTARFMTAMSIGLERIYRSDCWYKRAGVTLVGIEPRTSPQSSWLENPAERDRDSRLMQSFDLLNQKFGRKTIFFGTQSAGAKTYLKREFKSPAFTTRWTDIPSVT